MAEEDGVTTVQAGTALLFDLIKMIPSADKRDNLKNLLRVRALLAHNLVDLESRRQGVTPLLAAAVRY